MGKEFDSQPVNDKKSLKSEMKSYGSKIKIDFHGMKKNPNKQGSPYLFLSTTVITVLCLVY